MTNEYYVYLYLREDGTPYYVGKGKDDRAFKRRNMKYVQKPTDESRIMIQSKDLSEEDAFTLEKELIAKYGRKDIGTGILRNRTDGGDGPAGHIHTQESRNKMSVAQQKLWGNCDLEFKAKHSLATKKAMANPEIKAKHSAKMEEVRSRPEYRAKQSLAQKEKWKDPEYSAEMSVKLKEKWKDPEYRAMKSAIQKEVQKRPGVKEGLSEKAKLNMSDPEYKRRWKESINKPESKAKQASPENIQKRKDGLNKPEVVAKISATVKEKWKDPEYRLKASTSMREGWARKRAEKLQESTNLTEFFISDPVSN